MRRIPPRPARAPLLAAGLLATGLLAGCGGAPTTYLALAPVPPSSVPIAGGGGAPIGVARVEMPPTLDRLSLTSAGGAGTLHVAAHARWAAPLGRQAQMALAQDLAARLPGSTVLMPGDAPPPGGARQVHVSVQAFMPDGAGVVLDADWTVSAPDGGRAAAGRFHVRVPAGPTPGAAADAMSAALGRLADAIAARAG